MEIIKLDRGMAPDFIELISVFNEVFENENPVPAKAYLSSLLNNPDFIVVVAKEDGKVVGGLTAFVLRLYYSERPTVYIYDVGVKTNYQGKGIGKSLIAHINGYCKEKGFGESYVEAETEDIEAVNFYRRTNFTSEMQATHFTYAFENTPGTDTKA